MKKILLISTGGTIACVSSDNGLVPGKLDNSLFSGLKLNIDDVCISTLDLICKDSSNFNPSDWVKIVNAVKANKALYDAVVITHGTDTMAYTACALEFELAGINIPVILTGSQLPGNAPDSDAGKNIKDAVLTALDGTEGIFVVFAGRIIRGIRACKVYSLNRAAFESVNEPCAGIIENGVIHWRNTDKPSKYADFGKADLINGKSFEENIAVLKLFPGCSAGLMDMLIERGVKGIILEGFGCGGIICDENNDYVALIRKAVNNNITVVIASQCRYDGTNLSVYEVGVRAKRAGAIDSKDMTNEALTVKLMWALAHFTEQHRIKDFMNSNIVGEFVG